MVSIVFVALVAAGCKKRPQAVVQAPLPSVLTNRMSDAAYLAALNENRGAQTVKAGERHVIVTQMQACIARVQATLPKEADQAALKAALAQDAEWRGLEAQNAQALGAIEQVLSEARQKVRQRMLEESQAVQAVAAGKAKAAAPAAVP